MSHTQTKRIQGHVAAMCRVHFICCGDPARVLLQQHLFQRETSGITAHIDRASGRFFQQISLFNKSFVKILVLDLSTKRVPLVEN